jgi:S1-C subfamily serine protease
MGWGVSVAAQQNDAATYPDPVAEVIRHSVVRIGNARSSGTGFLVSDQGHVVTAWHVLNGINRGGGSISYMRSRFWIDFAGPETNPDDYCRVRANLIGVSEYRDVAMLRIRQEDWLRRSDPDCGSGRRTGCGGATRIIA